MSDEQQSREPIVSAWGEIPNYECPIILPNGDRCGFSHLDELAIREHLDPRWGPHKVFDETASVPVAVPPLTDDERAELDALRTENADLKRELTATKGQLTKTKNQLEKVTPDAEGDE